MNLLSSTDQNKSSLLHLLKALSLVFLFLIVFVLIYYSVQTNETTVTVLSTSAQLLIYSIVFSTLVAGLTTWFVGILIGIFPAASREHGAWFWPLMAGLLSLTVMGLGYVYLGVWPIGEKSVMMVDMHHQYGPLLNEMRDRLLHGGSIFYDFNLGLGGSFLPMFGYYLASPLNLLLVLFPERLLTEGIFVITLIKNTLCAVTFAACVQYIFRRRSPAIAIVAVMYSTMIYLIAYSWNIMWLDVILLLPVVVMSFEHLMRTGRYLPYVLSLALALFSNYYIGFMLCVFLVLYYIAYVLREKHALPDFGRSVVRFGIGSLLGGGLAMALLLPVALALGSTSAAGGTLPDIAKNFDLFSLFGRFLYGTEPTIRSGNLPNLYCGILGIFLLPVFITTKAIPARRRICMTAFFGVMGLSCVINRFDLLWHGLHAPNDLPYRFSFLVCFVLLLIAYETLQYLKEIRPWQIGVSLAAVVTLLMLIDRLDEDVEFATVYVSLGLAVLYAVVCGLIAHKKIVLRAGYVLLALVVAAELVTATSSTFIKLNHNEYFTRHADYVDCEEFFSAEAAVEKLKDSADDPFARYGLLPERTCVDTALFHYSGISYFASNNSYATTRFMGSLGYAINGVNSYLYHTYMPLTDALFSVKYIADKEEIHSKYMTEIGTSGEGDTQYHLYRSSAVLPLAWQVQKGTEGWKWQYYNPIRSINTLYQAMADMDEDLLRYNDIELYPGDDEVATVSGSHSFSIRPKNGKSTSASYYTMIEEEAPCFVYVDCHAAESVYIETRDAGEYEDDLAFYNSAGEPYMSYLGVLAPGAEVKVTVTSDISASGNIYIVSLDEALFDRCLETLSATGLEITDFSNDHITGTMSCDETATVLTSIPYDVGWTVKVDGKKVETFGLGVDNLEEVSGALLMFELPAGDHKVELVFSPRGFVPGLLMTIVSVILLVMVVLFMRTRVKPEPTAPVYPEGLVPAFNEAAFLEEFAAEIAEDAAISQVAEEAVPAEDTPTAPDSDPISPEGEEAP